MTVNFKRRFLKELSNIPTPTRTKIELFVFEQLPKMRKEEVISKIQKMSNYKNFYKARFSDYRVGIKLENDVITLERVLHRKEIYRYFP